MLLGCYRSLCAMRSAVWAWLEAEIELALFPVPNDLEFMILPDACTTMYWSGMVVLASEMWRACLVYLKRGSRLPSSVD